MAKKVGIVGAGVTPFKSKWYEKTYYELAQMATREAVKDAAISIRDIDGVFYGIYNDIFERACIPESPLQGIIVMQDRFGIRVSCGGATVSWASSSGSKGESASIPMMSVVLKVGLSMPQTIDRLLTGIM